MNTKQNVNEPLPASGLFAVGDVFTFIADHHEVTWTVFALTEYDVRLDRPSGGRVRGPMIIGRESLMIALSEDRARRVEPASDEIIRTHQMACAARLECEELREALRKAVAWGESASRHILYRENINWRYLDEARAVLDKANGAPAKRLGGLSAAAPQSPLQSEVRLRQGPEKNPDNTKNS